MKKIKNRFVLMLLLSVVSILSLQYGDYIVEREIINNVEQYAKIERLQKTLLQMRRAEKDFLLRKDEQYIEKLEKYSFNFSTELLEIDTNLVPLSFLTKIDAHMKEYVKYFIRITKIYEKIGFDEEKGLHKEFRSRAHMIEKDLQDKNSLEVSILLLQLRRAEKDFFMRHELKYIDRYNTFFQKLRSLEVTQEEMQHFKEYRDVFLQITKSMQTIGLKENIGLMGSMREAVHAGETLFIKLEADIVSKVKTNVKELGDMEMFISIGIIFFLILLFYFTLRPIFYSLNLFEEFFTGFKSSSQRLEPESLYFTEVKNIAKTVNTMLSTQEAIEEELHKSLDREVELQHVKDNFLTNMSHELRTPLNAIIGFASILHQRFPDENKKIKPIVDSAKHLLVIINDMLDIIKLQNGELSLVNKSFALRSSFETLLQEYEVLMQEKKLEFSFEFKLDDKIHLYGDWNRLSQIFCNLLSNAIKFTSEYDKISVVVTSDNTDLYIRVSDSGCGISEETMQRIFKSFEQADSSTTKVRAGMGIGLSLSYALAKAMHGGIEVKSILTEGSVFTLRLPLNETEALKEEATSENEKIDAHILVAEDNKTNQLLIGMLLDDVGITFDMAHNGLEAVQMYDKNEYDLVLMDESMPIMDGVEAMQKIREEHKSVVPIIAVTANVMKGDEDRLIHAGMDAFIPKPIDSEKLISTVKSFLDIKSER